MDERLSENGRPEWHRSDALAEELLTMLPEHKTGVKSEQDAISYAVAWFMLTYRPDWTTDE